MSRSQGEMEIRAAVFPVLNGDEGQAELAVAKIMAMFDALLVSKGSPTQRLGWLSQWLHGDVADGAEGLLHE